MTSEVRYCLECGNEIAADSEFCRHCGESLIDSTNSQETATKPDQSDDSTEERTPKLPITSVFVSILFLWVTMDLSTGSAVLIFGLPGILVIPRIRRYVVRWVDERYELDLTSKRVIGVVAVVYVILSVMALALVIGSTANSPAVTGSPTRQLAVGLLTIGIMYIIAIGIVILIRANRKLRN